MALIKLNVDNTRSIGSRKIHLEFSSERDVAVFLQEMKRLPATPDQGHQGELAHGGESKYSFTTPAELDGLPVQISVFAAPDKYYSPQGNHQPSGDEKQYVTHQASIEIDFGRSEKTPALTDRNLFAVEELLREHHVDTGLKKFELLKHLDASNELSTHGRGGLVDVAEREQKKEIGFVDMVKNRHPDNSRTPNH